MPTNVVNVIPWHEVGATTTSMGVTPAGVVQVGLSVQIESDFQGWLLEQANALRTRNTLALDWVHLAEELEAMAATDRRELLSRLTTLFEHLLKLSHQVGEVSRRGRGWRVTVTRTRTEIRRLLDQSPGLKGQLDQFVLEAYSDARAIAGEQIGLERHQWEQLFAATNPWPRALFDDFFP